MNRPLVTANFPQSYDVPFTNIPQFHYTPECNPPKCFIASYPPVTPAGHVGPFFVNTYFLQTDRVRELGGPVSLRSSRCN